MKNIFSYLLNTPILAVVLFLIVCCGLDAQSSHESGYTERSTTEVLNADTLFWKAYNICDLNGMKPFLAEDLEFYHDKNGLTKGLINFMESLENGICANIGRRLRREAVEGSIKVYPLENYGAIITGEHLFYIKEDGKKERLDGKARFTHLWRYKKSEWRMSRILSYDHQPMAYKIPKVEIKVPDEVLNQYLGNYESKRIGSVVVDKEYQSLTLQAGEFKVNIHPETENLFFVKGRDLQFEFMKNEENGVLKIIVHENGEVVEEIKRIQ